MMVVVSYDVKTSDPGGARRLRHISKLCLNRGQRVQFSVFECIVDPAQWTILKNSLEQEIDPKADSLRYYFLGANWTHRVEHFGAKEVKNLEDDVLLI